MDLIDPDAHCRSCKYLGKYKGHKLFWCKLNETDTQNMLFLDRSNITELIYWNIFPRRKIQQEMILLYIYYLNNNHDKTL